MTKRTEAERVMKESAKAADRAGTGDTDIRRLVLAAKRSTGYRYAVDGAVAFFFFDGSKLIRGFPLGEGCPAWETA